MKKSIQVGLVPVYFGSSIDALAKWYELVYERAKMAVSKTEKKKDLLTDIAEKITKSLLEEGESKELTYGDLEIILSIILINYALMFQDDTGKSGHLCLDTIYLIASEGLDGVMVKRENK